MAMIKFAVLALKIILFLIVALAGIYGTAVVCWHLREMGVFSRIRDGLEFLSSRPETITTGLIMVTFAILIIRIDRMNRHIQALERHLDHVIHIVSLHQVANGKAKVNEASKAKGFPI